MTIDIAFESFPILETERLILRESRLSDTPEMFINMSDMDVMRQIGTGYVHQTVEESRRLIRKMHGWYARKEAIRWVITLKSGDDKLLGTLGFHEFGYDAKKIELGYELNKQYWGQGIMSEAVIKILRYGFDVMEAQRIEAATDGINERSHKLLKQLGFTQEACLRRRIYYFDTYWDEYWFGLLVAEFNRIHKK